MSNNVNLKESTKSSMTSLTGSEDYDSEMLGSSSSSSSLVERNPNVKSARRVDHSNHNLSSREDVFSSNSSNSSVDISETSCRELEDSHNKILFHNVTSPATASASANSLPAFSSRSPHKIKKSKIIKSLQKSKKEAIARKKNSYKVNKEMNQSMERSIESKHHHNMLISPSISNDIPAISNSRSSSSFGTPHHNQDHHYQQQQQQQKEGFYTHRHHDMRMIEKVKEQQDGFYYDLQRAKAQMQQEQEGYYHDPAYRAKSQPMPLMFHKKPPSPSTYSPAPKPVSVAASTFAISRNNFETMNFSQTVPSASPVAKKKRPYKKKPPSSAHRGSSTASTSPINSSSVTSSRPTQSSIPIYHHHYAQSLPDPKLVKSDASIASSKQGSASTTLTQRHLSQSSAQQTNSSNEQSNTMNYKPPLPQAPLHAANGPVLLLPSGCDDPHYTNHWATWSIKSMQECLSSSLAKQYQIQVVRQANQAYAAILGGFQGNSVIGLFNTPDEAVRRAVTAANVIHDLCPGFSEEFEDFDTTSPSSSALHFDSPLDNHCQPSSKLLQQHHQPIFVSRHKTTPASLCNTRAVVIPPEEDEEDEEDDIENIEDLETIIQEHTIDTNAIEDESYKKKSNYDDEEEYQDVQLNNHTTELKTKSPSNTHTLYSASQRKVEQQSTVGNFANAKACQVLDAKTGELLHVFKSVCEAERITRVSRSAINRICKQGGGNIDGKYFQFLSNHENEQSNKQDKRAKLINSIPQSSQYTLHNSSDTSQQISENTLLSYFRKLTPSKYIQDKTCLICQTAPACTIFYPCMHCVLCAKCSQTFCQTFCPSCRCIIDKRQICNSFKNEQDTSKVYIRPKIYSYYNISAAVNDLPHEN